MLYVINIEDKTIHKVRKYIIENDGTESVWCDTWHGRHIIGRHCDFVSEKNGEQQERMYSEEDFKLFARQYYREIKLDKSNLLWDVLADKSFEQFKKK